MAHEQRTSRHDAAKAIREEIDGYLLRANECYTQLAYKDGDSFRAKADELSRQFAGELEYLRTQEETASQKYMVSYQLHNGKCGNITGTLADVVLYRDTNAGSWKSYSFFLCVPAQGFSITNNLLPCDETGTLTEPHIPTQENN